METLTSHPSFRYERKRLQLLAEHVRGSRILDIGYAHMPNHYLLAADRHVTGIDLVKPHATTRYDRLLQGDVFKLRDLDGGQKYDTIVAGEFIEHVEAPYELLRYLAESLTDGGRLVLSTPNPASFPVLFFEWVISRRRFYTYDHTFYFNPRWVLRLLERTGYHVIGIAGVGLWPLALPCPIGWSYQVVYVAVRPDTSIL